MVSGGCIGDISAGGCLKVLPRIRYPGLLAQSICLIAYTLPELYANTEKGKHYRRLTPNGRCRDDGSHGPGSRALSGLYNWNSWDISAEVDQGIGFIHIDFVGLRSDFDR